MSNKRLYRSRKEKMLAGVCGGIGEYLDTDPTIIRLVWILITIASFGMGIIGYIVALIVMPEQPSSNAKPKAKKEGKKGKK